MTIAEQLIEAGPRLTAAVLVEMYKDPFWEQRFGARGRHHSQKDGDYHVQYLLQALAADDARVFESYAKWLREVLVTRGMCSAHLAENFVRLADAIDAEPWDDRARASAILRRGASALRYTEGDAAALEAMDLDGTYASYLKDAVAFAAPERFAAYCKTMPPPAGAIAALRRDGLPAAAVACLASVEAV